MKTNIALMLLLTQSSAFAAFNTFQCTSKKLIITKPMPYKDTLNYQDLTTGYPTERNSVEHASWPIPSQPRGDKEIFSFRRYTAQGTFLYNLVVTENSPGSERATAILYLTNDEGKWNQVIDRKLICKVE